ncbi:signal peptidase I [Bacillota bacterium]
MSSGKEDKRTFKEKYRVYIAAGITAWVIFMFIHPVAMKGNAMEPTLKDGQIIIVSKETFKKEPPEIASVVNFHKDFNGAEGDGSSRIMRVVGIPGDTIEIRSGKLYRNGEKAEEPYASGSLGEDYGAVVLKEGEIFVLGDNREESLDSRRLGPLQITDLRGTCSIIIWPAAEWGRIK